MNAKEFIEKFGWEKAISVRNDFCDGFYLFSLADGYVDRIAGFQLSEYIDAYELVQKYKGTRGIRFRIRWGQYRYGDSAKLNDQLKQAITLLQEINA